MPRCHRLQRNSLMRCVSTVAHLPRPHAARAKDLGPSGAGEFEAEPTFQGGLSDVGGLDCLPECLACS
jgi:hypothetical protein